MAKKELDRDKMYHNLVDPTPAIIEALVDMKKTLDGLAGNNNEGVATKQDVENLNTRIDLLTDKLSEYFTGLDDTPTE